MSALARTLWGKAVQGYDFVNNMPAVVDQKVGQRIQKNLSPELAEKAMSVVRVIPLVYGSYYLPGSAIAGLGIAGSITTSPIVKKYIGNVPFVQTEERLETISLVFALRALTGPFSLPEAAGNMLFAAAYLKLADQLNKKFDSKQQTPQPIQKMESHEDNGSSSVTTAVAHSPAVPGKGFFANLTPWGKKDVVAAEPKKEEKPVAALSSGDQVEKKDT